MNETYQDLEGYPLRKKYLLESYRMEIMDFSEDKYFTPSIEDIRVGYECEFLKDPSKEPSEQEWIPMTLKNRQHGWTMNYGMSLSSLRVPCLTKEQIEKEGWIPIEEGMSWKPYLRKGEYSLLYHKRLEITGPNVSYLGECKDINTFRYICKLLGI